MKNKNWIYALGVSAIGGTAALGAGATLDNFDTFTSTYAGQSGFYLTQNSVGTATDAAETLLNPSDTDFSVLTRKAELILISGNQTSTLANGTITPSLSPLGHMLWGNQGSDTDARLTYTFTPTVNLSAFSQIDFNWISSEAGSSVNVDIVSIGNGSLTTSIAIPNSVGFTQSIPFASMAGNQLAITTAKRITITFSTINPDYDGRLNSITFSNPNVPEASVSIPALAVLGGLGFVAWRRRKA